MSNIIETPIIAEVEQSFLDYSLSVITDRAIPSAIIGVSIILLIKPPQQHLSD